MKNIFLVLALLFSFSTFAQSNALNPNEKESVNGPVMSFETTVLDYGKIEHKTDGNRSFVLTNTGNAPLIISNVKGSCGCTVPTWSRDPLAPGQSTEIGVKYDTKRIGKFTKTITLTTNSSEKTKILTIKGEVLKPAAKPVAPAKTTKSPLEVK
jgi:hypothetical protein